jgi:hypothetical protein
MSSSLSFNLAHSLYKRVHCHPPRAGIACDLDFDFYLSSRVEETPLPAEEVEWPLPSPRPAASGGKLDPIVGHQVRYSVISIQSTPLVEHGCVAGLVSAQGGRRPETSLAWCLFCLISVRRVRPFPKAQK